MRAAIIVSSSIFLASCASGEQAAKDPASTASAQPPASAPAAVSQPQFKLAGTALDKLGTAPSGFGLKVGDKAPDASLPDVSGETESLAALFSQGPTLLIFYRGGWCRFCNLWLHDYAVAKPEFDRRGVRGVAISVDKPSEEAKTQAKHGVAFPMLSDSKLVAHQAYRVVHVPGDAERTGMAAYGIDLAAYSGESHGDFAVPANFPDRSRRHRALRSRRRGLQDTTEREADARRRGPDLRNEVIVTAAAVERNGG
jgi:peroxiredoxin